MYLNIEWWCARNIPNAGNSSGKFAIFVRAFRYFNLTIMNNTILFESPTVFVSMLTYYRKTGRHSGDSKSVKKKVVCPFAYKSVGQRCANSILNIFYDYFVKMKSPRYRIRINQPFLDFCLFLLLSNEYSRGVEKYFRDAPRCWEKFLG